MRVAASTWTARWRQRARRWRRWASAAYRAPPSPERPQLVTSPGDDATGLRRPPPFPGTYGREILVPENNTTWGGRNDHTQGLHRRHDRRHGRRSLRRLRTAACDACTRAAGTSTPRGGGERPPREDRGCACALRLPGRHGLDGAQGE